MSSENKQRLTLLSTKEKRSAVSGGAVDDAIPEDLLRQRLRNEAGVSFDSHAIIKVVASRAGYCRGFNVPGIPGPVQPARMEPAELVKQAITTCAVIDELIVRMKSMHPDLTCWVNDALYRGRGETVGTLRDRVQPDLYLLRAAVVQAGSVIAERPVRTGPKRSPWLLARDAIAATLREHSQPVIAAKAAKPLAVDLLELCGLPSPRRRR